MEIKILGTGCAKCAQLYENATAAVDALALDATVEKVTKLEEIVAHGVMMTPALVVDGEVRVSGKAPSVEELKGILGR